MRTHLCVFLVLPVITHTEVLLDNRQNARNVLGDGKSRTFDDANARNYEDEEDVTTPVIYDDSEYVELGSPLFTEPLDVNKTNTNKFRITKELRTVRKEAGGSLKLRCEVVGGPPATSWRWFKNDAPVIIEKGRVRIKSGLDDRPQWTMLKINVLETLDTAFYKCAASNGLETVESTGIVRVALGSFGTLPKNFPPAAVDFTGGMNGGSNIEFEGRQPDFNQGGGGGGPGTQLSETELKRLQEGNPSLVPDENGGTCEPYVGTVCKQYIGQNFIYISEKLEQKYIEQKLQGVFKVITASPDLSSKCAEFALPSICLSTFAICDKTRKRPRKICRDECEILERDVCQSELAIAKRHPLLGHQMVLPDCEKLPPIGSPESGDCVKLGFPLADQLIQPHSCYSAHGQEYRGTAALTRSGLHCVPWSHQTELNTVDHLELIGGHNYCRNPGDPEYKEREPWCFTNDDLVRREVCAVPRCTEFNLWLYIAVPAVSAVAIIGLSVGLCCMRRKTPPAKPLIAPSGTLRGFQTQINQQGNMEMNPLINTNNRPKKNRAMEIPISSIRFMQELGEGAFGKVYKGELAGYIGGVPALVAIKTLKPGANQKTIGDFVRESELMADLKHPNIVCLIGVCMQEEPKCMVFEHMAHGDLHEFLIFHSPKSDMNDSDDSQDGKVITQSEMAYIAIQIAAGMEYLSSHHYVHRDLAARNCLVGENLTVKISDFGLSRDIYSADYYRVQTKSLLPVRWMPPESILYGKFTTESDVWAFGVVLWEIYSFGLQPYYGYSNSEVIEMIRSRQLLPCPEDCPSRMYAFMVECWHEIPARRPVFSEIHQRLLQWEGVGSVGYQPSTTSHSMGNNSQQSGSHSSTGPSNNTGSTNLSNQMNPYLRAPYNQGGPPFNHQGPPVPHPNYTPNHSNNYTPNHSTPVRYHGNFGPPGPRGGSYTPNMQQISGGVVNGHHQHPQPHNVIVGPYQGQQYQHQGSGPPSHCGTPSVASLQMV